MNTKELSHFFSNLMKVYRIWITSTEKLAIAYLTTEK